MINKCIQFIVIGSIFSRSNSFIIKSRISTSSRLLTRMTDTNTNSSPIQQIKDSPIQSNETRPIKTFLLTCSYQYYPSCGDGDWKGCYATIEEAEEAWNQIPDKRYQSYEIIDLKDWIYDVEPTPDQKEK